MVFKKILILIFAAFLAQSIQSMDHTLAAEDQQFIEDFKRHIRQENSYSLSRMILKIKNDPKKQEFCFALLNNTLSLLNEDCKNSILGNILDALPTKKIFYNFLKINFVTICNSPFAKQFLEICKNSDTPLEESKCRTIIDLIITNFKLLLGSDDGRNTILEGIAQSKEADLKKFETLIADNFWAIYGTSPQFVILIAKIFKDTVFSLIHANFEQFINAPYGMSTYGPSTLEEIIRQGTFSPEQCLQLFPLIMHNFTVIIKAINGSLITYYLPYESAAKEIIEKLFQNIHLVSNFVIDMVITKLYFENPLHLEPLLLQCLDSILNEKDKNLIILIFKLYHKHHSKVPQLIIHKLAQKIDFFDDFDFHELLYYEPSEILINAIIQSKKQSQEIKEFAKDIKNILLESSSQISPTYIHLRRNFVAARSDRKRFIQDRQLSHMLKTCLQKENELNEQGYYTFVHGQQNWLGFIEECHTLLWQLRTKKSAPNFLFAHVKDSITTLEEKQYHTMLRNFLRAQGTYRNINPSTPNFFLDTRLHVLFLNYAFFGNSNNIGSSSAAYIIDNKNSPAGRTISLNPKDSFVMHGYQAIYEKYKNEIEQLHSDFVKVSQFGNILLFAIPKEKVNKYVYLAYGGGPKRGIEIAGIGEAYDTQLILETLIHNPEKITDTDRLEFCLIMTQHKGGLDPKTGIQVHLIRSGEPKKLKELEARKHKLFAKIKADIQTEEAKEKALQRAAILANQIIENKDQHPIRRNPTHERMQILLSHIQPSK